MIGSGLTTHVVDILSAPVIATLHDAARRPFDESWSARSVAEVLAMPGTAAWVSNVDGSPAGFVIVRSAADECEILTIGVTRDHRRAGVGQGLVEAALEVARLGGARRVYLEVAEDNGPARAFYAFLGFSEIGLRPGYYRRDDGAVDAHILARDLDR